MNRELLEKFVALAPPEWKVCRHEDMEGWLCLDAVGSQWFELMPLDHSADSYLLIVLDNDRASAEAIVFLWDYLESQGQLVAICRAVCNELGVTKPSPCVIWGPAGPVIAKDGMIIRQNQYGDTRIEALVRACVALWESRTQEAQ